MILVTHAIAGAALGRFSSSYLLSFCVGFVSHFLLDAIPHWHYRLHSVVGSTDLMKRDMIFGKSFMRDIFWIGSDFFSGMILGVLIFQGSGSMQSFLVLIFGALGGVIPDALQFVFWKLKREPLIAIQKFHEWIHARRKLDNNPWFGIPFQIAIALIIVIFSKMFA